MANIIVADNSKPVCGFISNALTGSGHHVAQANSGEEAIVFVRKDIYDVAIVDLTIDEANGIALLKIIKDIFPETEVIMIAGPSAVDEAVEAMKLGAYDFITKPVNIEELLLIVERALEKRELTDSVRALRAQVKDR